LPPSRGFFVNSRKETLMLALKAIAAVLLKVALLSEGGIW
jgi:hypothetical protein